MRAEWRKAAGAWPVDLTGDPTLRASFDLLRTKWGEVPFGKMERQHSKAILSLADDELLSQWTEGYNARSTGTAFSTSGWYQTLYKDVFRGKRVLDVGCGLAPDTVFFAEEGARVTFIDLVESNVRVVERICALKGLKDVAFLYMEDLTSLERLGTFDFLYCGGSFINAPLEVARMEAQALLKHLPPGGRWVELGYPQIRWEREGRMPETEWGQRTDGWAPWIEWHDLEKLQYMLAPAIFEVIMYFDFHDADFNWFDLIRRD